MHGASLRDRVAVVREAMHMRRPLASASVAHTARELDVGTALAWVQRLLEDAEESGSITTGMTAGELAAGLRQRDPDFDPLAAGFPTRLMFVRYALTFTRYELRHDERGQARLARSSTTGTGPR